ncbi:MAG: hypothetical protein RRY72_08280 [Bacteroides sp.]
MDNIEIIKEILEKECERYELRKYGFIRDIESVYCSMACEYAGSLKHDSFSNWKNELVRDFYIRHKYSLFYQSNQGSGKFYSLIKRLMKGVLSVARHECRETTIDRELRVHYPSTIAFKLTSPLYEVIYGNHFGTVQLFNTPIELEEYCKNSLEQYYPLDKNTLLEQLQSNDNELWSELLKVIHAITQRIVYSWGVSRARFNEIVEEISANTRMTFLKKLDEKATERYQSGTHLYNSLQEICRYKMHELQKEEMRNEPVSFEEGWEDYDIEDVATDAELLSLEEVDVSNEYEMAQAIVQILCEGKGELYDLLIGKEQKKVDVLWQHIYCGRKYEELALEDNPGLKGLMLQTRCAGMRQENKRARNYLLRRIKLVICYVQGDKGTLKLLQS